MKFYMLSHAIKRGTAWATSSPSFPSKVYITCPVTGKVHLDRLDRHSRPNVGIMISKVGTFDDVVPIVPMRAVSQRFIELYKAARLKGLSFVDPAEVILKGGKPRSARAAQCLEEASKLKIMYVRGSGGSIAKTSSLRINSVCSACDFVVWTAPQQGVIIDESQWDGSDFFHVDEYWPMLISERAAKRLSGKGLSNWFVEDAAEFRQPFPE